MVRLKNLTREMVESFLDGIIQSGKELPHKRKAVRYHLLYKGYEFPPKYVVTEIMNVNPAEVGLRDCIKRLRGLNFEIIKQ
jgi:hypothetical protein